MAYADYLHCAICDVKLIYVGERDETDESIVCESCHDKALAAERTRTIEECKAWICKRCRMRVPCAECEFRDIEASLKAKGGKP